ncbi:MAG: penicillin acylase family protein [Flavobacteriaceae bacterium]|nr:penicillin acylase family protein [Flavobacteriaceae bacterium]
MKRLVLILSAISIVNTTFSQEIDVKNIEILRDSYGVPHIYAKTDAELAYGLAWAHSEDDFRTIQEAYLAGNGLLSKHIGLRGAPADFLTQLIRSDYVVDSLYNTIDKKFIKVIEGYAQGINKFAELNPDQVLVKKLFPITPKKMVKYSFLQLFISSEGDKAIRSIFENNVTNISFLDENKLGSNLFAFSTNITKNGETYLGINTHQPLDGPTSWYEAHLVSEEGTNIIGATFAGAPCILTGTNENLGWTHTVNYPDKTDIFQLEMVDRKNYKFDDQILKLKTYKAKAYIKILGIPIRVKKKYYESIYGPTLKNKNGFYSVRTASLFHIRGLEQWWKMNKAKNFTEFYDILKMNQIPGYNIGYADKNDTIFYISNGIIPKRNDAYNWETIVPGNTKKTLWNKYYKTDELPQVISPKSGYVYNANHSPFKSTSIEENPEPNDFAKNMNFELYDNNRSKRIFELINSYESINYNDFKEIKYDHTFPTPFHYNFMDVNQIMDMSPEDYPEIKELLTEIQEWDRKTNIESIGAGTYAMFYYSLNKYYRKNYINRNFGKDIIAQALKDVKERMIKYFKTTKVKLGDYQKLVRGNKEIPIWGMPDVITAMNANNYKKGKIRVTHGESYIQFAKFSKKGTEIESIISYGSSDHEDSEHYSDQMNIYKKFGTKKMSFDKETNYKNAKKIYNPK